MSTQETRKEEEKKKIPSSPVGGKWHQAILGRLSNLFALTLWPESGPKSPAQAISLTEDDEGLWMFWFFCLKKF